MTIGKICVRNVDQAELDEAIWQAAERMHQRGVGALIVVDEEQTPVGIITDRDIVERVVAVGRDPQSTRVREVMTAAPTVVRDDIGLHAALEKMRAHGVRRLPIVNDYEQLVGLITLDDVVMLLADELMSVGRLIERQTPQVALGKG